MYPNCFYTLIWHVEMEDNDPAEESQESVKRREVVGKFNRHARLVMEPPGVLTGKGARNSAGTRPRVVDTAAKATDMPELRASGEETPPKLEIKNKGLYQRQRGASAPPPPVRSLQIGSRPESPHPQGVSIEEARALLGTGFSILKRSPVLAEAVPSVDQALLSLRKCTMDSDLGVGNAFSLQGYPEDFVSGMHRHFQIVGELLRHFYATMDRPKGDTAAGNKLVRLEGSMAKKYKELRELRASLEISATGNKLSAVIKPLLDCLDHAFQALQQRKAGDEGEGDKGGWLQ
ncbi:unnamed protein product [Choristocarpus tenellus]